MPGLVDMWNGRRFTPSATAAFDLVIIAQFRKFIFNMRSLKQEMGYEKMHGIITKLILDDGFVLRYKFNCISKEMIYRLKYSKQLQTRNKERTILTYFALWMDDYLFRTQATESTMNTENIKEFENKSINDDTDDQ
eukprot:41989_1